MLPTALGALLVLAVLVAAGRRALRQSFRAPRFAEDVDGAIAPAGREAHHA
jgi:hypothetical protein